MLAVLPQFVGTDLEFVALTPADGPLCERPGRSGHSGFDIRCPTRGRRAPGALPSARRNPLSREANATRSDSRQQPLDGAAHGNVGSRAACAHDSPSSRHRRSDPASRGTAQRESMRSSPSRKLSAIFMRRKVSTRLECTSSTTGSMTEPLRTGRPVSRPSETNCGCRRTRFSWPRSGKSACAKGRTSLPRQPFSRHRGCPTPTF